MKISTFLLLFFIVITFSVQAQNQLAISGKITDPGSNAVKGASVRLLNTNFNALTNNEGVFTINNIFPGTYTLAASAIGYATLTQTVVVSAESQNLSIVIAKEPTILSEVVVTAQKREELLQQVPISTTSLSSRQVEEYRLWNIKDVTAIVPNLYSSDPGDRRNVTSVRGITTTSYDPAVATYIDGVNQFNLDTYIAQLFDVERIEVLRGPQGTLYGRTAMGGVINIITKQPTNKTDVFGEATVGNFGLQRYSAAVRTPLIKNKLFLGVSGVYDRSNGFYTNEFNNSKYDKQNSFTGNYYLKYQPGEKWVYTLNVKHNNNRNNGPFPVVPGVEDALSNPYKLSQNAITKLIDNNFNSSLSINYTNRSFNFSSQTAYQSNYRIYNSPIDADFSPIDGITLINNYGTDWNKVKIYTQEFKFSSPALLKSNLNWTAGFYGFYQNNPVKQATRFGEDAAMVDPSITEKNFSLINSSRGKSEGAAIYGQATYKITKHFNVTGGIRYDYEKRKQSVLGEYQQDPNPDPIFQTQPDTSTKASFKAISPKFTASYNVSEKNMLFTTFSRGYRPGGLTQLSSDPSVPPLYTYKPEYSNNFEAGIKNTFLNNKLLLNITAFYSTVTDAQVPTLILPDAITITKNTGKLKSKGIELEASTAVSNFQLNYSFGYTDAEYTTLKVAQYGTEVDLKGKKQIFTPDVTSMAAGQYNLLLSKKSNLQLLFRGEWRYLGKQYFDLANNLGQSPYSLLNARIELRATKTSLTIWGRNLADKKYISYGYDFGAVRLGDPRTYGATVSVRL